MSLAVLVLAACRAPATESPDLRDADVDARPADSVADPEPDPSSPEPAEPAGPAVPVLGGTLYLADGRAFAADPEGDRIFAFDVAARAFAWVVDLPEGSTPFRLTSGDGYLFASLRGTASLARIDVETRAQSELDPACDEPRGVAWDEERASLWVACAGGELN